MMMELPENIITGIDYLSLFFQLVGAIIVSFGGFRALYQLWMASLRKGSFSFLHIKKNLIQALVFGLDFFIIGDALTTLIAPDIGHGDTVDTNRRGEDRAQRLPHEGAEGREGDPGRSTTDPFQTRHRPQVHQPDLAAGVYLCRPHVRIAQHRGKRPPFGGVGEVHARSQR